MFAEWDGTSPTFFLVEDRPVGTTDIGIVCHEDAPDGLLALDYIRDHKDVEWVEGWVAVVPVGENGVVAMCSSDSGLETEVLEVRYELGPDPYSICRPECMVSDNTIIRLDSLCGEPFNFWTYIQLMGGENVKTEVRTREELYGLLRKLSQMEVVRGNR